MSDPRTPLESPRQAMLSELAQLVTGAPWSLSRQHRERAHAAGLEDAEILHAITLSAFFGHLNRIADVVAVPLDYQVRLSPPPVDRAVPPWPTSPRAVVGRPAIATSLRPATFQAITAWRTYMFDRDAPLTRRHRTFVARWVALWLGDGGISDPGDLTMTPIDGALLRLTEQVTLAPWRVEHASFDLLRASGFDESAIFDACAVASTAGMVSRITVALSALGREHT